MYSEIWYSLRFINSNDQKNLNKLIYIYHNLFDINL